MPMIRLIEPTQPVAPFAIDEDRLTIGDITITFAEHQRDEAVTIEIRKTTDGFSVGGDGAYVATVRIPPRRTHEEPGEDVDPMTGQPSVRTITEPLDTGAVEIILWPYA